MRAEQVLGVEELEAAGVELGRRVVGVARARLVGGGDVARGGAGAVAAFTIERRLVLELLAGLLALVGGQARLQPLGGDAVVAARALGRHQLQDEVVLEVVLEDVLGLARHRRVGHLEQIVALDQLLERGLDARPLLDGERVRSPSSCRADAGPRARRARRPSRASPPSPAGPARAATSEAMRAWIASSTDIGSVASSARCGVDAPLAAAAVGRRLHRAVGVEHAHQLLDEEGIAARQLARVLDELARQRLRLGEQAAQAASPTRRRDNGGRSSRE